MDENIGDLYAQTERTKLQFLRTELQVCRTALDMAVYQLSVRNIQVAQKEVAIVQKAILLIEGYFSKVTPQQKSALEAGLAELRAILEPIEADLKKVLP